MKSFEIDAVAEELELVPLLEPIIESAPESTPAPCRLTVEAVNQGVMEAQRIFREQADREGVSLTSLLHAPRALYEIALNTTEQPADHDHKIPLQAITRQLDGVLEAAQNVASEGNMGFAVTHDWPYERLLLLDWIADHTGIDRFTTDQAGLAAAKAKMIFRHAGGDDGITFEQIRSAALDPALYELAFSVSDEPGDELYVIPYEALEERLDEIVADVGPISDRAANEHEYAATADAASPLIHAKVWDWMAQS